MKGPSKAIFLILMSTAMFCGFMPLFVGPDFEYDFQRLHIFLFNLCSSCTVLLYYTEGLHRFSLRVGAFLVLSLLYAFAAFAEIYPVAILLAAVLTILVEVIRVRRFSVLPVDCLDPRVEVSEKFHHAALLCLSIGLFMSGLVILNNEYLKLISLAKLQLNTFFLGFSFPISLISMSVIFSQMRKEAAQGIVFMKEAAFWIVNLGVIIFFLFILFELHLPQVTIAFILFGAVAMILYLYLRLGIRRQQKNFLASGMLFLVFAALTGIAYIVLGLSPAYGTEQAKLLLRVHAFASLYGWNLSGLAVIFRSREFPIRLHSVGIIALHWVTVTILAPLGNYSRVTAIVASCCYLIILFVILFSPGSGELARGTESGRR